MPEPLSLFAQTMLEEDEKFYATFPEARKAAIAQQWRYQQAPLGQYFEGPGFQYHCSEPSADRAASYYHDRHWSDTYASYATNSAHAYLETPFLRNYGYSASMEGLGSGARLLDSIQHGRAERQSGWDIAHLIQHYTVRVFLFHSKYTISTRII
jgi:hypothetical protein